MNFGSIETRYAGHLFRSRLEARWAVFFDTLGIKWKYEHEGYECEGQRYLPDFEFGGDFFEVKGDPTGLRSDFKRMQKMLGCISPLPGFIEGKSSLVLLGEIPRSSGSGITAHPCLMRSKEYGLERRWCAFLPTHKGVGLIQIEDGVLARVGGLSFDRQLDNSADAPGWMVESRRVQMAGSFPLIDEAYEAARSARFEHGQEGAG